MNTSRKTTRKEREKQRHKTEILHAAERVFAEKGYERARMSDIAIEAEFSVGYLYQTWESKEDLYASLFESKFKEFKKFVQKRIATTTDALEQVNLLIDSSLDFIDENRPFVRLYLAETSPSEIRLLGKMGARIRRLHNTYHQFVEKIFARGVERGVFVALSPGDLALTLDGIIFAFAKDHVKSNSSRSFTRRGEVIKQVFFNSILNKPTRAERN